MCGLTTCGCEDTRRQYWTRGVLSKPSIRPPVIWGEERARDGRVSAVTVLLFAGFGVGSAHAGGVQSLEVLSGRADLVSGGDALVAAKVTGPATVDVDGPDVTSAFAMRPSGRLEGLVTG